MLVFGDEYGRSQAGCNNGWCQDALSWFSWSDCAKEESKLFRFTKLLIALRKSYAHIFNRTGFLGEKDIWWRVYWDDPYNYVCYVLHDQKAVGGYSGLLIAFNAGPENKSCDLPDGKEWHRLIDTNLPSPKDFCDDEKEATKINSKSYGMQPFSCIVLKCMGDKNDGIAYGDSEKSYQQQQQVAAHLGEVVRRRMSMELLPSVLPEQVRASSMMRRLSSMSGLTVALLNGEAKEVEPLLIERAPSSSLLMPLSMSSCLLPCAESEPEDTTPAPRNDARSDAAVHPPAPKYDPPARAVVDGVATGKIDVCFSLQVSCTNAGESVFVAGSSAALGAWDPAKSLRCSTTANTFPVWRSEVCPMIVEGGKLEFKLLIGPEASRDGKRWEDGPNRSVQLPDKLSPNQVLELSCAWGSSEIVAKVS